jgi:hypothetical protein
MFAVFTRLLRSLLLIQSIGHSRARLLPLPAPEKNLLETNRDSPSAIDEYIGYSSGRTGRTIVFVAEGSSRSFM